MRILVADDDPQSVKLTAFLLEEAGYQVIRTHDSQHIIPIVEQNAPDLVVLDVSMPRTSGFEICRQLRRTSDIPIIFVSGRNQLNDRVEGLRIGGDDYLTKPFEPAELLARIEAVLRRRSPDPLNPVTRLSRGPMTLDPVEHQVILNDQRNIRLTPLEFRLIYYLMQHAGRIISAETLLDKVWGYGAESDSNLVAVYVRRLRAKVELDPERPQHIITVRHLGYRFDV